MKIYIAGRYSRREEILHYGEELAILGHRISSLWLRGTHEAKDAKPTHEEAAHWALDDLLGIGRCDMFLAFTEGADCPGKARGGRHVEMGYALAQSKRVCIVGPRENVFCHLPEVDAFPDWSAFYAWMQLGGYTKMRDGLPAIPMPDRSEGMLFTGEPDETAKEKAAQKARKIMGVE